MVSILFDIFILLKRQTRYSEHFRRQFERKTDTVESGYIIHEIYHPAAYIGLFRPELNFYIIKPPDISSSPPVISVTLRGARGNISALRAAQTAKVVILDKLKLLKHGTSQSSAAEQLNIIGFGCFHNTVAI